MGLNKRPALFTRIREAAYVLAPRVFPRPPWVSRWSPICACNGLSVRGFIGDLRTVANDDLDVTLCPETARRLADMLEPYCCFESPITITGGNVVTSSSATFMAPQMERRFPPISPHDE
jgi:hypothetical protein